MSGDAYDSLSLADLKPRALAARAESERHTLLAAGRSLQTQNKSRAQQRREAARRIKQLNALCDRLSIKLHALEKAYVAKHVPLADALLEASIELEAARQLLDDNAPLSFKWAPGP